MAHLLQVDVEWVVRRIGRYGAGGFFFGVFDFFAVSFNFVFVEQFDVEVVENVHDILD